MAYHLARFGTVVCYRYRNGYRNGDAMKVATVGQMRERVSIQSQAQTVDGGGAITTTWTEVNSCWARMKPLNMQQLLLAGRDESVRTYMMTIRYRTDITTAHRIEIGRAHV